MDEELNDSQAHEPSRLASLIVSGPGSVGERWAKLEELAVQHPDDEGVICYFESLAMQREAFAVSQLGAVDSDETAQTAVEGVLRAFSDFLAVYETWGGFNYHGWDDYPDPRNYKGCRGAPAPRSQNPRAAMSLPRDDARLDVRVRRRPVRDELGGRDVSASRTTP